MAKVWNSSIHCVWDTPLHFLKTNFCIESGFLSFLELQKSLQVSFQGCWTQWQRFESSSISLFLIYPTAFSQNTFLFRKWLPFILELQKSLQVSFRGAEHNGIGLKALAFTVSEILHFIFSKFFFLESGFLSFLEVQKSLQVSFQGCWTQWQRFETLAFTMSEIPHYIFS